MGSQSKSLCKWYKVIKGPFYGCLVVWFKSSHYNSGCNKKDYQSSGHEFEPWHDHSFFSKIGESHGNQCHSFSTNVIESVF